MEEIFGPVLVALPFRTAKEAIALANNTLYGLAASVHSEQLTLALETAKHIQAIGFILMKFEIEKRFKLDFT